MHAPTRNEALPSMGAGEAAPGSVVIREIAQGQRSFANVDNEPTLTCRPTKVLVPIEK